MMQPFKNVSKITMSAPYPSTKGRTIVAIIAVGPMVILLQEPKMIYTNEAMKDAYNPYWRQKQKLKRKCDILSWATKKEARDSNERLVRKTIPRDKNGNERS